MSLDQLLISLGVNLASSVIYDVLKSLVLKSGYFSRQDLKTELQKLLMIENADIVSDAVIDFLARNGSITISGSKIFAEDSISFESAIGTKFEIKNGSSSSTSHTSIDVGRNASVIGQNGATIKQSKEGVSFFV